MLEARLFMAAQSSVLSPPEPTEPIPGGLWTFGYNNLSQTGINMTSGSQLTPTQVGSDITWSTITMGESCGLGIKENGTLWSWGNNASGITGQGVSTGYFGSPTQVGTDSDWITVSIKASHALAIKADGTLWATGINNHGRTGLGTTSGNTLFFTKVGVDTNWAQITTFSTGSFAIKTDGTLWGWGNNSVGQLGLGDGTARSTPTQIGTDSDWTKVIGGYGGGIALKSDRTLWGWGYNNKGELGIGNTSTSNVPIQLQVSADWIDIAGYDFTIALKEDGTLWSAGSNNMGQLGINSRIDQHVFTQIGEDTDWRYITANKTHALAIKTDGSLWSWGENTYGQLGLGNSGSGSERLVPTRIGEDTNWMKIACSHTGSSAAIRI